MLISNNLEFRVFSLERQHRGLHQMMLDQQAIVAQMVGYQSEVNSSHDKWHQGIQKQLEVGPAI